MRPNYGVRKLILLAAAGPAAQSGRDKWKELTGGYIPDTLPVWSKAFQRLNRDSRMPDPPPKYVSGYRFPDPGLVIFSMGRRERNLFNWLLVRDATIRRATHDLGTAIGIPTGVSNEMWRLYIGTDFVESLSAVPESARSSSRVAQSDGKEFNIKRRQVLIDLFGKPPDRHHVREVQWRGHEVTWDTFFKHDSLLVREIMWDLHQHSFQYDMIAIDRHLAQEQWNREPDRRRQLLATVFGQTDNLGVEDMPDKGVGLASDDAVERRAAYDALACLMHDWPESPDTCNGDDAEFVAAISYCTVFAKTLGRPPIMPKIVPKLNLCDGRIPYRRKE
ncbi:hypothetical protein HWV62_44317 [Athelia sp. TMB]|nr:hypothetical protein HWV62_44317 [Athelia sp. TMB]